MAKENSEPLALLGLLECPFRKGYIEFEYEPGDTTASLRKRVADLWGLPAALGRGLDHDNWHGGFSDRGLWVILCEDEVGAYLTLKDNDPIPITFPEAGGHSEHATISLEKEQRWNLPRGLVYDTDVSEIFRFGESVEYKSPGRRRLRLALHREYETPKGKSYSVKLIALIVITGG